MNVARQSESNRAVMTARPGANATPLILSFVGIATIGVACILEARLAGGPMRSVVLTILISMGAYFIAIGLWAIWSPLAASLAGFGVFLPFWGTSIMLDPTLWNRPVFMSILVLIVLAVTICLVACVIASSKQKLRQLVAGGLSRDVARYYLRAVSMTVCVLAAMLLATIMLVHAYAKEGKLTMPTLAMSALIVATAALAVAWTYWPQLKDSLRRVGRWWWYPVAICGGLGTAMLAGTYIEAIEGVVPREIMESMTLFDASCGWIGLLVWVAIAPAITEEVLFRGVMLGAYRRVMGPGPALVATALMFMGMHAMPIVFPVLLVVGLILGYLRLRSGSVYPCILMHFVHNAAVLTLGFLAG